MINPSEISEVLKQQLENVNNKVSFEEVGTVLEVGDGVAHVYGLENVRANELVEFENGVKGVAMNLEESNVGVILLNNIDRVTENMTVRRTGEIASIPVGEGLLGRVTIVWVNRLTVQALFRATSTACPWSERPPELYSVSL